MRIMQGENLWLLVRTDRDGASLEEVKNTVGPAMAIFLREAQPAGAGSAGIVVERAINTAPDTWRIGVARPVVVGTPERLSAVGASGPKLPAGEVLATRASFEGDVLPTVTGTDPWFIPVSFWWRGSNTEVPYPVLKVSDLGVRSRDAVGADWYLDRAILPKVKGADPGDESFGVAIEERAAEAAKEAAAIGSKVLVVAGILGAVALAGYLTLATGRTR